MRDPMVRRAPDGYITQCHDDWDTSNDEPVDEDMAQSVINSYTDNYAKLDWTILVQE